MTKIFLSLASVVLIAQSSTLLPMMRVRTAAHVFAKSNSRTLFIVASKTRDNFLLAAEDAGGVGPELARLQRAAMAVHDVLARAQQDVPVKSDVGLAKKKGYNPLCIEPRNSKEEKNL